MDVALDSNIYVAMLQSRGRKFFESNQLVELFAYLRRTKSNLLIPGPVLEEVVKEYHEKLAVAVKAAADAWTTLQYKALANLPRTKTFNIRKDVDTFQKRFLEPEHAQKPIVLDDYSPVSVGELVRRGVYRIRPANGNGEELRDVVIWFLVLDYAKRSKRQVAFISADRAFNDDSGKLHEVLSEDIRQHKADVLCFSSLSDFIKQNAIESESIDLSEITTLASPSQITALIKQKLLYYPFSQGTVELVELGDVQFNSARRYKVSNNSYYVETIHTGTTYLDIFERPRNSKFRLDDGRVVEFDDEALARPDVRYRIRDILSRVGRSESLVVQPVTARLKSIYECAYEATLSIRVVDGKTEAPEVVLLSLNKISRHGPPLGDYR